MNRILKAFNFIYKFGFKALPERVYGEYLLRTGKAPVVKPPEPAPVSPPVSVHQLLRDRFSYLSPLRVFSSPGLPERRLNLVTDSINSGSLFGGVGTSLILSSLLARRWNAGLRIITRTQNSDKRNFEQVLGPNHISIPESVEFVFADIKHPAVEIPVSDGDVFLTTSWWTTWSVKQAINPRKILYLLQEDERAFFPFGDDHLMASEVMQDPAIQVIVNSKMLADHLIAEGFETVRQTGLWFEPAWSQDVFFFNPLLPKARKNFFFYARPNNIRNLFFRGIEVIEGAIVKGILNPSEWDFYFAGREIPNLTLNGISPKRFENLAWADYGALVRKMDLGLCLMYTPHPSYPPLDMAASGAVAVTNRFGAKKNLDQYSENILCRDVGVESLIQGIAEGVQLASDPETRLKHYQNNHISRDWNASFEDVLRRLERWPFDVHP
jgi:hypothetical protein